MTAAVMNCWNEQPARLLVTINSFRQFYPEAPVVVYQDGRHRPDIAQALEPLGVEYRVRHDQSKNFILGHTYTAAWLSVVAGFDYPVFKFDPDTVFYRPFRDLDAHAAYTGLQHAGGLFLFGGCIVLHPSFAQVLIDSPHAGPELVRQCEYWRGYSEDLYLGELARRHSIPLTPSGEVVRYKGTQPPARSERVYAVSIKSGDN